MNSIYLLDLKAMQDIDVLSNQRFIFIIGNSFVSYDSYVKSRSLSLFNFVSDYIL